MPPAASTAFCMPVLSKSCPARVIITVGLAHDNLAVAVAEQADELPHEFGASDDAGQVFGVAEVGF